VLRGSACLLALAAIAVTGCGGSSGSSSGSGHTGSAPAATTTGEVTAATATTPQASSGASNVVSVQAGSLSATMHAGTHRPRAGRPWPFSFTVTRAGAPARASVGYQYLLAGQIVARRSHYTFTGHFADVTFWPRSAAGYPLTLRAVVVSGGTTVYLDYPVQVIR
jgi:hypothetical protein